MTLGGWHMLFSRHGSFAIGQVGIEVTCDKFEDRRNQLCFARIRIRYAACCIGLQPQIFD